jgi:HlyD family secretion protein
MFYAASARIKCFPRFPPKQRIPISTAGELRFGYPFELALLRLHDRTEMTSMKKWFKWIVLALILSVAAVVGWRHYAAGNEKAVASGNGRIEATEIDIDAKIPGRIRQIIVDEGDFVKAEEAIAQMDTDTLEAQLWENKAKLQEAMGALEKARSEVVQRESEKDAAAAAVTQRQSEKAAAIAVVAQRAAEYNVGKKRFARSSQLAKEGAMTQLEADDDQALVEKGAAAVATAEAQVAAASAAIVTALGQQAAASAAIITARAQIKQQEANIEAAKASIQRVQSDINDSTLRSPRDGRVQYKVAQQGEVMGPGGHVLNVVDLSDVYMTFFLPTNLVGRVKVGNEARIVLDAAPQYVIPAYISYVSDVAQFTPKTVETKTEREKLMFRLKAQIPPELLKEHIKMVKTGVPGVAYVLVDPNAQWPSNLAVRLP